ncbi:MAG: hypothetical protein SVM79_02225 [Chloroflexota bacterium]|nr:hypothetical protein [Chloroflexota bacterium]
MREMKSALERAMERAEKLGKLSPEELQQKRKAEYALIGEGLAKRYLEHGYMRSLSEGIDKYKKEERSFVTDAVLFALTQSIVLENETLTERALMGINGLKVSRTITDTSDEIMSIFGKYAWEEKLLYADSAEEIEDHIREALRQMGISGTAVGEANIQANETWKTKINELRFKFNSQLDELKESLIQAPKSA